MAPPVAYERQACLGIYTTHVKNTTRLLCSKVSKLGRPSINKISVALSHLLKPKNIFNTFVITQLEFGQAPSIVLDHKQASYKQIQYARNITSFTSREHLIKRRTSRFVLMNILRISRCISSLSFLLENIMCPRYLKETEHKNYTVLTVRKLMNRSVNS